MDRTFTEVLASRRMCRDFEATTLASGTAESLVDAATRAPAAGNTHALDFVVLEGPQTSLYWDTTLAQHRRDGFRWPGLLRAPMLLVAYVEPGAYVRRYSEPDKAHSGLGDDPGDWAVPYWYVDGGAAVMAVLLAAETLGLGSLLFGQFGHEQAVADALGVPQGHRSVGTIAVGRRAVGERSRSKSAGRGRPVVGEILHRGRW
ncbi:MAG: nitroreductase family protein [Actinomycetia bacterium]|nr:nitroreductase family protein [Actinomycetes bacterium]